MIKQSKWMMLFATFCISTTLLPCAGYCQMVFNPILDQPATTYAQGIFNQAFTLECAVFQQYNPGTTCGVDTLIRNASLQAWGLTTPVGVGITQTRYSPTSLQPLDTNYGAGATFFILSHEIGHHFDLQAKTATVPWAATFPPVPTAAPLIMQSWDRELRADAWAGCAMKRGGVPTMAAAQLTALTASWIGPDVPPVPSVVAAINAGYHAC